MCSRTLLCLKSPRLVSSKNPFIWDHSCFDYKTVKNLIFPFKINIKTCRLLWFGTILRILIYIYIYVCVCVCVCVCVYVRAFVILCECVCSVRCLRVAVYLVTFWCQFSFVFSINVICVDNLIAEMTRKIWSDHHRKIQQSRFCLMTTSIKTDLVKYSIHDDFVAKIKTGESETSWRSG